jgi:hypothetical protein
MDNGGSPDGDDRQSSDSRPGSDREGSHHSENGHSPRPAGRSRSRFVFLTHHFDLFTVDFYLNLEALVILAGLVAIVEAARVVAREGNSKFLLFLIWNIYLRYFTLFLFFSSRHGSPEEKRTKRSRSPMSSRRRHVGNRENPPTGRCLGIFGLSIYTQERDLKEVFSKYGPIEDVQIVYDAQTGRSRGFSFVYFENKEDAAEVN